jgi:hypothetical protein
MSIPRLAPVASLIAGLTLLSVCAGCSNPYKTVAKIGVKLVGDAVEEEEVENQAQELLGKPPATADAAFGQAEDMAVDQKSGREVRAYAVKNDVLGNHRWIVEIDRGRIVALSKAKRDPGGGTDIARRVLLDQKLLGKSRVEIESDSRFARPQNVLKRPATGEWIRIYDVSSYTDMGEKRYCVLIFSPDEVCREVRLVGSVGARGSTTVGR